MAWQRLKDEPKIREIFEYLVSKGVPVSVRTGDENGPFASKVLKLKLGDLNSKIGKKSEFILERLVPERGNALVQSSKDVSMEFQVRGNRCRCPVKCLGISSDYPFFGVIMGIPEGVEVEEKRREERIACEGLDFLFVEFGLTLEAKDNKVFTLQVLDRSVKGLGLLVTQKDFGLFRLLKPGDHIGNMTFYASAAMIQVSGTVRHITKIDRGRHRGSYIVGIMSQEIIESSMWNGKQ